MCEQEDIDRSDAVKNFVVMHLVLLTYEQNFQEK